MISSNEKWYHCLNCEKPINRNCLVEYNSCPYCFYVYSCLPFENRKQNSFIPLKEVDWVTAIKYGIDIIKEKKDAQI